MAYLLANQDSELDRLQAQSRVWEPAGQSLLHLIGPGTGLRALDLGCGCLGWLRILSEWVGPKGNVTGTDISDSLLAMADIFLKEEKLTNVNIVKDDFFSTKLKPHSFDLVHSRYLISPLGRASEQIRIYANLVKENGLIIIEDPIMASWKYYPVAPAAQELVNIIGKTFIRSGGNPDAGAVVPQLLRNIGLKPEIQTIVLPLQPGHPYLRLPLQFATSLEQKIIEHISMDELQMLRKHAEVELSNPMRWGTTFTLAQSWARVSQSSNGAAS